MLNRIPRSVRVAFLAVSIAVFTLAIYAILFRSTATLNLVCRHNLRNAELSVSIDGKLVHVEQISGSAKKRFGLFDTRIEGSFSKALAVPTGHHVIQVHVRSAADGFDQIKSCGVNLVSGQEASVVVTTSRGGMSLAYRGPAVEAAEPIVSTYFNSIRTILVTVFGSAVSAAIGFVVQEALRSRKSPAPLQNQNS